MDVERDFVWEGSPFKHMKETANNGLTDGNRTNLLE